MDKWSYTILNLIFFLPFIVVFWFGIYSKLFSQKLRFVLISGFLGLVYFFIVDLPATSWGAWTIDYSKTLNMRFGNSVLEELIWTILVFMMIAFVLEILLKRKENTSNGSSSPG